MVREEYAVDYGLWLLATTEAHSHRVYIMSASCYSIGSSRTSCPLEQFTKVDQR